MSRLTAFKLRLAFTFALLSICTIASFAQNPAKISVTGEVTTPLELTLTDLAGFKQISHKAKDHDGKEHEFTGVALFGILEKAGVTTGNKLRGKNLTKYVLVSAADGYEVLYALPEIDPEFTDQVILLAIAKDGQPMGKGEGPFRIIVPNDKRPARWIREVQAIRIGMQK